MSVEINNTIRLVFVSQFSTPQRLLDTKVLDSLREQFDVEWWDCAEIVYPKYYEVNSGLSYVIKIRSLSELKLNLRRIPRDTLLVKAIPVLWKNRHVDKLLAKYFPKIIMLEMYSNTPSFFVNNTEEREAGKTRSLISAIKKPLYQSYTLKTAIKILFHPAQRNVLSEYWQIRKEWFRFRECLVINCAKGSEYYINHPDVEQYVRLQSSPERRTDRFIVFIDQNFPYHVDLRVWQPDIKIEDLARRFFPSINRFFNHLEKVYDCKVVIAVHPKAQYRDNPFEGREMVSFSTAALVRDSIGVCMHSSNALSFVMLYDKPVVSMVNGAIKDVDHQYNQIINTVNHCGVPLVDTDSPLYEDFPLSNLNPETRRQYIEYYFGDIDTASLRSNTELLKKHFHSIYQKYYA